MSGDDMNIIQVGRPAVKNEGINYDVHDFPTSELGLKLGRFVTLSSVTVGDNQSESDVCDDISIETRNASKAGFRPHVDWFHLRHEVSN